MSTHLRPEIVVGPFFVRTPDEGLVSEKVARVGAAMEFATVNGSMRIPLFRKICSYAPARCQLEELLLRSCDLPCDVQYWSFYAVETGVEVFIPLEAVLAGIFREFSVHRTGMAVLADLASTVQLDFQRACLARCLVEALETEGFELSLDSSYGRTVTGAACWVPPPERNNSEPGGILACFVEFRPRPDGTLGKGTWKEPRPEGISSQLCRELQQRVRGTPIEMLTAVGRQKLLAMFDWTPLARMTAKQAREARLRFIRAHPELKANARALAEALRNAELYAESTTVHQVMKFLPSLLSESELPAK